MNLELNVVRFENEDVIATSCHEAVEHAYVSQLCTNTDPIPHDGNGVATFFDPCEGGHDGKYIIDSYDGFCQHGFSITEPGWYHIEFDEQGGPDTVTPCPNGGISQDQVCGDWEAPGHDYW